MTIFLVFFITTNENTWESLYKMNRSSLFLAFGLMLFAAFADALRIKATVEAVNEKISIVESLKTYYISNFAGGITPFFSGTLPAQIYIFSNRIACRLPLGKATMVATIIPILKTLVFTIFTPIIFFTCRKTITSYNAISIVLLNTAILISLMLLILFINVVRSPHKVIHFIQKIQKIPSLSKFFKNKKVLYLSNKIITEIYVFQQSFDLLKKNWLKILMALIYTMIFWGTFFTIAPIILWGMNITFNFSHVLILQVIFYFILPYMPTPGGSGAAEIGFASLFSFFVPHFLLGLFVTAWRFVFFYFNLMIGLLILLLEMKKISFIKT